MKGGGPHITGLLPQHPLPTILQLIGCLVGEGDGQYLPRAGGLHGTQIIRQGLLLRVRVPDILLQKLYLIVGDGHGDLLRVAAPAIAQKVGHPVDKHRGLAAAGSGQQKKRPLRGEHRLPLLVVEMLIVQGDGLPPCPNKTLLQFIHVLLSPACCFPLF